MKMDFEKEEFIKYYENELFELMEGCWVLNKSSNNCGYQIVSDVDKMVLPDKIYSKYNNPPIYLPNIVDIKYMIDAYDIKLFNNKQDLDLLNTINIKKMLINKDKSMKQYSILLKIKKYGEKSFYVCYDYKFSKFNYLNKKDNEYDLLEKRKKEIEYKLFILKRLESKL